MTEQIDDGPPDASTDGPEKDAKSAPADREQSGPFDEAEARAVRPYIDLGAIKILPREGLNLRLEVEEQTKRIVAVGLDYAGSTLQVQAFAAPRSTGLWNETRDQIRAQKCRLWPEPIRRQVSASRASSVWTDPGGSCVASSAAPRPPMWRLQHRSRICSARSSWCAGPPRCPPET